MSATELIEKALGVIRTSGWTKGFRWDREGRVCALGALDTASGVVNGYEQRGSDYAEAVRILSSLIPREWEPRLYTRGSLDEVGSVAQYNNDHDQATVENWFEKAALHGCLTQPGLLG